MPKLSEREYKELLVNSIIRAYRLEENTMIREILMNRNVWQLKYMYNRECIRTKSEHYAIRNGRTNE